MSGIVSGVTKVFTAVGSAVARVGSAVGAVGASVFTAGAASGAGSMGSGAFSSMLQSVTGDGVLGNVLSGALKTAIPGALIGGAVGAMTGTGFMKGAMMGGLGGAAMGGINAYGAGQSPGVDTMTTGSVSQSSNAGRLSPEGGGISGGNGLIQSSVPQVNPATGQAVTNAATSSTVPEQTAAGALVKKEAGGFGAFLNSETGAGLIGGLGKGFTAKAQADALAAENQKNRDATAAEQASRTASYDMAPGTFSRGRLSYDPAAGRVVRA